MGEMKASTARYSTTQCMDFSQYGIDCFLIVSIKEWIFLDFFFDSYVYWPENIV